MSREDISGGVINLAGKHVQILDERFLLIEALIIGTSATARKNLAAPQCLCFSVALRLPSLPGIRSEGSEFSGSVVLGSSMVNTSPTPLALGAKKLEFTPPSRKMYPCWRPPRRTLLG